MDIAGAGGKWFNSTASPPPCWAAMVESRCPALLRSVFFRGLGYQRIATGGNWLTQKYLWQQGGIAAPLNLRDGQSSCTGLQPQRCSCHGTILQKLFDIWGSNMQSEQLARNLSLGLGRLWTICNLCTNKPPEFLVFHTRKTQTGTFITVPAQSCTVPKICILLWNKQRWCSFFSKGVLYIPTGGGTYNNSK